MLCSEAEALCGASRCVLGRGIFYPVPSWIKLRSSVLPDSFSGTGFSPGARYPCWEVLSHSAGVFECGEPRASRCAPAPLDFPMLTFRWVFGCKRKTSTYMFARMHVEHGLTCAHLSQVVCGLCIAALGLVGLVVELTNITSLLTTPTTRYLILAC